MSFFIPRRPSTQRLLVPAPYSARHKQYLPEKGNQKKRDALEQAMARLRRRDVQRLADLQALGIQTGIDRHQALQLDAIFPRDGRR